MFSGHEQYSQFLNKIHPDLFNEQREKLALLSGYIIIILVYISDRFDGDVALLGSDPYTVSTFHPLKIVRTFIQIGIYGLITAGAISGVNMAIILVRSIYKIGLEENYSLNLEELDEDVDLTQQSALSSYSLKRFKRKTNAIPQAILPICLIFMIIILLSGSSVLYFIILREQDFIFTNIAIFFVILFLLIDLYVFFIPQYSIYKVIKKKKTEATDLLDELYEKKKILWLTAKEDNVKQYWGEVLALTIFIEDIENISPWPFNYAQIIILGVSLIVGLVFIFEFIGFIELFILLT